MLFPFTPLLLLLTACPGDAPPERRETTDDRDDAVVPVPPTESRVHPRDYGFAFWPANHWEPWGTFHDVQHVQTGWYALSIDWSTGSLGHLGTLSDALPAAQAALLANDVVTSLPDARVRYGASRGGERWTAERMLDRSGATANPSELVDMGRIMQRIDVPGIRYAGASDLAGRLTLAAMPRHFVLTHTVTEATGTAVAHIALDGRAVTGLTETTWLVADRAVQVHDGAGNGWTFIVPEGARGRRDADGSLAFEATGTLSVLATPLAASDADQLALWLSPEDALSVTSAQLARDGTPVEAPVPATYDPVRGVWVVPLRSLADVGGPGAREFDDPAAHTFYNRHALVLVNHRGTSVAAPLAFDGDGGAAAYITGGSPLLRDEGLEPTGIPVQISKNWHDGPAWYHLYAMPLLPTGETRLEHTFAHARWGTAYAVQHAQLSLVGWGQNQQWDQSSIGAFGESITYDPDLTLGRSMVDDVRPLLVDAGTRWSWTGNVGGASFLVYDPADRVESRPDRPLERVRTHYAATGPTLTDVHTTGVTHDGRIEAEIHAQLGRTDDLVRAWYHLRYTVLEDVTYDRLALFQVASDRYADNGFRRWAYGNAGGAVVDAAVPAHGTTGYEDDGSRGIPLEGEAPWVFLYDNGATGGSLPEHLANVGFVVRDYRVTRQGSVTTTPHINLQRTFNGGSSQVAFELGLPTDGADRALLAGTVIEATVEYLVPPALREAYYGESDHLLALPASAFPSTEMMRHLAEGNTLAVEATVGSVLRVHPVELAAATGTTAADFTVTGGLGYVPITIRGLPRPDGWVLESEGAEGWVPVPMEVEGGDGWQASDAGDGLYSLTYTVPNRETQRYRLVRRSER